MSLIPKPRKVCATMSETKALSKKIIQKTPMESVNVPQLAHAIKKTGHVQKASTGTVKRPLQASNKTATAPAVDRKPMKRLAAPPTADIKPKVLKPNPPKPAPYDYKARFNLLKEQHDNLKSAFGKNKERLVEVTYENENLLGSNEKLTAELKKCTDELLLLRPRNAELETENKSLKEQLADCQKKLISNEEKLTTTLSQNKELKAILAENLIQVDTLTKTNEKLLEQVQKNASQIEELKEELIKLDTNRRILHNEIQDLKGNIRVFCRIRPSLPEEKYRFLCNINYTDEKSLEISKGKESIEPTGRLTTNRSEFTFDKVFSPFVSQEDVFVELAQLVRSALDGYHVCVFAYGQTGSGKTYTMDGANTEDSLGMIPRAIDLIFNTFTQMQKLDWTFTVKATFLEIYNEIIIDLLSTKKNQHEIRMTDSKATDVYVTNLSVETVSSAAELKHYMRIAQSKRSVAATENNDRSSRSHSVTKIYIECVRSGKNEKCHGSLNLIDLAGSERMTTTNSSRVKETQNINKSLANLSNVILALVQKQEHVPYRNSKLTHLLMPCLGGNSKTLMLVNIAPFEDCFNESLNSLRFASIVNQCKTGNVKKNKILNSQTL